MAGIRNWDAAFNEINCIFNGHLLNKLIVAKNIGHTLIRLELSWPFYVPTNQKSLSLAALAQLCTNLEHLDLRQVRSDYTESSKYKQKQLIVVSLKLMGLC